LPDAPPKPGPTTPLERMREGVTGIQNGLTEAAITLEFSGLLNAYPGVVVQVANLGGALAYYQGRWAHTEQRLFPDRPSWDGRLQRILVDTGSLGAKAISFAAEVYGADRLLFGTDAPIYSQAQGADAFRAALGGARTEALQPA
jgi:predicted TIM-barrel fold metal-dependent hydrolase